MKSPLILFIQLMVVLSFFSSCLPSQDSPFPGAIGTHGDSTPQDSLPSGHDMNSSGPGEGGGGDPDTQHFIIMSKKLSSYLRDLPKSSIDAKAFGEIVEKLDNSIKDPSLKDLVEFTDQPLQDQSQVSKMALYDKAKGSIQIYRPYWESASDSDKLTLIMMEISGLMGVEMRYERARALVHDRTTLILSMRIDSEGEKTPIGWRLAEQDADIFSRLTEKSTIIDGGIIGTGSESNQRVVEFLNNPFSDEEWIELSHKAFSQQLPAYIVLRDELGQSASITGFREYRGSDQKASIAIYSLFFSAKSKPVGQCEHHSDELTALERLNNCFFDTRFYHIWDADSGESFVADDHTQRERAWQDAFHKLHEQMIHHYAKNKVASGLALKNAVYPDYSALFPPPFRNQVLHESSLANGLKPTLLKGDSPFWEMAKSSNESAIRFYSALELMAKERVGFFAGNHPRCMMVSDESKMAPQVPPQILPLDKAKTIFNENNCLLRDGSFLEALFYEALAQAGYVYNSDQKGWLKSSPRQIPKGLMRAQFKKPQELQIRYVTEALSIDEYFSLIEQEIRNSDLTERLGIYYESLADLQRLGLSQNRVEKIYRQALAELTQLGPDESPVASEDSLVFSGTELRPLDSFVNKSMGLAVRNKLVSPELSKDFVHQVLKASWLNADMAYEWIYYHFHTEGVSASEFVYFKTIFEELLSRPFFDEHLASTLVRDIVKPYYGGFSGHGKGIYYPYQDLNDLLEKILKLNVLNSEDLELLKPYIPMFKMASELEAETLGLSPDAKAKRLTQLLSTPESAATLSDVIARFLITNPLSQGVRNQLINTFLETVKGLSDENLRFQGLSEMSGVLPSLVNLPYLVDMDPEMQERLFEFVIVTIGNKGKNTQWAKRVIISKLFDHRYWKVKLMPAAQRALELASEHSVEAKNEDFISVENSWEFTETNRILTDLNICIEKSRPETVCQFITSPKAIIEKVVANENIHPEVRSRAKQMLTEF